MDKVYVMDEEKIESVSHLDQPRFDFSRVSYRDGRESAKIQARINHMGKKIESIGPDDDIDVLMSQWDALMDQQEKHIFAAVAYVPQSWLIKGAPMAADIDWQDSNSVQWLRADKLQALGKAKNDAQNAPN